MVFIAQEMRKSHDKILTSSSWPRNVAESLNSLAMARACERRVFCRRSLESRCDKVCKWCFGLVRQSKWLLPFDVWCLVLKCTTTSPRHSHALAPRRIVACLRLVRPKLHQTSTCLNVTVLHVTSILQKSERHQMISHVVSHTGIPD